MTLFGHACFVINLCPRTPSSSRPGSGASPASPACSDSGASAALHRRAARAPPASRASAAPCRARRSSRNPRRPWSRSSAGTPPLRLRVSRCSVRMRSHLSSASENMRLTSSSMIPGGLLGVALRGAEIAADEQAVRAVLERDGAEALAHAVAHHHGAGEAGSTAVYHPAAPVEISSRKSLSATRPPSDMTIFLKQLLARAEVLQVLLRAEEREAPGPAARDDGYIVHRVGVLKVFAGDGVSRLVVGREFFRLGQT